MQFSMKQRISNLNQCEDDIYWVLNDLSSNAQILIRYSWKRKNTSDFHSAQRAIELTESVAVLGDDMLDSVAKACRSL